MAVVPFAVMKSGVPAVQRGIQRALLWVGLPIVVLAAWAFQGGVQDPKLDTTDTQLVLKSLMLGQFVKANQWPASEGAGTFDVAVHNKPALVEALARAFKRQGIPVAGVDRMILTDQLAVMDLIKLGEFLLLPEDDLTLATVLKSPLIGLDEADLFELAHDRGGAGLWRALRRRAHERPGWVRADAQLLAWLDRADRTPPHELFAGILAEGGWHAIIGRLGPDAVDPLDEFLSQALAYEQTHVPSLQGFLHWLAAAEFEVKRDLEGAGGGQVRIMTAHGAKGLQAPIVFLPDTLQVPKSTPRLLWDTDAAGAPLLLWPPRSGDDDRRAGTCRAAARAAISTGRAEQVMRQDGRNPPKRGGDFADGAVYFCTMSMKRLSDLGPTECGVIERVDTPEEVLALVQMGCCIGSKVEVRHVAPSDGPMAICTCGRTLAVRKEAAAHLWVRVAADATEVA